MFVAWNEIRFVSFHIVCCFSIRRTQASWLAFIWWDHIMPHSNIFTNTFDIFAVPIHYFLCPNVFFNRHKKQSTMFNRKKYAIRTKREENHQRRVCNYKWTAQSAIFCCVFLLYFSSLHSCSCSCSFLFLLVSWHCFFFSIWPYTMIHFAGKMYVYVFFLKISVQILQMLSTFSNYSSIRSDLCPETFF